MAPRQWKRPLTLIYDNNYKYGTNLYSGAIDDIERKYLSSMSRTRLPVDRPDVSLTSFAGSSLATGQRDVTTASTTAVHEETSSYDLRKVKSVADFDLYRSLHDWTPTLATIPSRSSYIEGTTAAAQEAEENRRRRRRRRRAEDLDRLELHSIGAYSPSFSTYGYGERASEKMDVSFWMDKCRHFQTELDSLIHRVTETESQIKADSVSAKNKIQAGIVELAHELEDTTRQSGELQKVIKRQAKHLAELQSLYDEVQRHLTDAAEELGGNERRCHHLQSELDSIKYSLEQASRTRVHAW